MGLPTTRGPVHLRGLNHSLQSGWPRLAADTLRPGKCDAWITRTSPDRLHCRGGRGGVSSLKGRTSREGGKQLLTSLFSRNLDLSVFCVHAKMPRALTLLIALCITPHPGASAWPTLQPHLLHGGAGEPPRLSRERRVCACSVLPNSCDPVDCSCQAPLSTGFSRQEYQSGLPLPPPDPGSNPPLSPLLHWWVSSRSAPRER